MLRRAIPTWVIGRVTIHSSWPSSAQRLLTLSTPTACFHAAAAILILLLSACSEKPLVISADTSCERFRHISANDEQIKVFADNWAVMESYADQILAHNTEYDAKCLKEPK